MELRKLEDIVISGMVSPPYNTTSSKGGPAPVTLTCHVLPTSSRSLFAGRSDGAVLAWLDRPGGRAEIKEHLLEGHKGTITSMIVAEELGNHGMLITASADRTVRLWDPCAAEEKACVQILTGHGGTVNCVAEGRGRILSCSNDSTIRVWGPERRDNLLLYPWFTCQQVIRHGDCWVTSLGIRGGEAMVVYATDSTGRLTCYAPAPSSLGRERSATAGQFVPYLLGPGGGHHVDQGDGGGSGGGGSFGGGSFGSGGGGGRSSMLNASSLQIHRLGVSHTLLVPERNFIITLSHDHTLRVFDAMTGAGFLTVENRRRCKFTGLDWHGEQQELYVVDALGYVQTAVCVCVCVCCGGEDMTCLCVCVGCGCVWLQHQFWQTVVMPLLN